MSRSPERVLDAPVLETERLRLRGHSVSDFADCYAMWSDTEVTRYIGGRPFTQEEVWARILRYAGHWAMMGYGYWAVEEKAGGRYAGDIGLADFKREITPPLDAPEVGWALPSHAQGKGYATEALQAVLAWADTHLESLRTVCIIIPENLASIRVARKCGFQQLRTAQYRADAVVIYERKRL